MKTGCFWAEGVCVGARRSSFGRREGVLGEKFIFPEKGFCGVKKGIVEVHRGVWGGEKGFLG